MKNKSMFSLHVTPCWFVRRC